MKSSYSYIKQAWQDAGKRELREKTNEWRKGLAISRIERPSKLGRAHALGYKAKQGYVMVRVRIRKGGRSRRTIRKGRRPTNVGLVSFTTSMSKQAIAERRAAKKFPNLEVLNSYYIAEDGRNKYYEIILVDPH
ncbi:MAG: 50S ribosomal protein L15e, partial [Candidatus Aenigmarchaeota archaeon]|nr:50S ribosomal protein L15e [Candidatus Aenigmarchaeota archaeon]MDI6722870.1 50S ribosomal protein L15e [Candidatus Aenigmarchaeota archaeon]